MENMQSVKGVGQSGKRCGDFVVTENEEERTVVKSLVGRQTDAKKKTGQCNETIRLARQVETDLSP